MATKQIKKRKKWDDKIKKLYSKGAPKIQKLKTIANEKIKRSKDPKDKKVYLIEAHADFRRFFTGESLKEHLKGDLPYNLLLPDLVITYHKNPILLCDVKMREELKEYDGTLLDPLQKEEARLINSLTIADSNIWFNLFETCNYDTKNLHGGIMHDYITIPPDKFIEKIMEGCRKYVREEWKGRIFEVFDLPGEYIPTRKALKAYESGDKDFFLPLIKFRAVR